MTSVGAINKNLLRPSVRRSSCPILGPPTASNGRTKMAKRGERERERKREGEELYKKPAKNALL